MGFFRFRSEMHHFKGEKLDEKQKTTTTEGVKMLFSDLNYERMLAGFECPI